MLFAALWVLGCGGSSRTPRDARDAPPPDTLVDLLPAGVYGLLRMDLVQSPASREAQDADHIPFLVSDRLTEAVIAFVERDDDQVVFLLRGDIDRRDLDREIVAIRTFQGDETSVRVERRLGHDVYVLPDLVFVDLGDGTWVMATSSDLVEEVIEVRAGRRPPSSLQPALREMADIVALERATCGRGPPAPFAPSAGASTATHGCGSSSLRTRPIPRQRSSSRWTHAPRVGSWSRSSEPSARTSTRTSSGPVRTGTASSSAAR
jgi:hypothetical protein